MLNKIANWIERHLFQAHIEPERFRNHWGYSMLLPRDLK